jgi:hypothetical protein
MAPELYEESYSESVDVYAFGMCVLEMTSKEYPYEECSNAAQIWKKVTGGQKPDVLNRVHDSQVREFINLCICPQENRLTSSELLAHPFLSFRKSDSYLRDNMVVTVEPRSKPNSRPGSKPTSGNGPAPVIKDMFPVQSPPAQHANGGGPQQSPISSPPAHPLGTGGPVKGLPHRPPSANGHHPPTLQQQGSLNNSAFFQPLTPQPQSTQRALHQSGSHPSHLGSHMDGAPASAQTGVSAILVEIESAHGATANIVLHIHLDGGRRKKQIKFALDFRSDTSMSLAGEMVQSLKLPDGERTQMLIASAMEAKIEPVRKHYFATMAQESSSPTGSGQGELESPNNEGGAIFTHTSYTTSTPTPTNATAAANGANAKSIYRQPSFPPTGEKAGMPSLTRPLSIPSATPTPTGLKLQQAPLQATSPLPPHPMRTVQQGTGAPPNTRVNTATNDPNMRPSPMQQHGQMQQPPRPNTAQGVAGGPAGGPPSLVRPSTAHASPPAAVSRLTSMPAAGSTLPKENPQIRQTFSQPCDQQHAGEDWTQAQHPPQQQGHVILPPQSPPRGSLNMHASLNQGNKQHQSFVATEPLNSPSEGLLTLDAFESSEEYEAYLEKEFKALPTSTLKEKLKSRPGGMDLVKACFERADLVQMLIRITAQEGSNTPSLKTATSLPQRGSTIAAGAVHPHPHQSFSGSPDFLSPEPMPSSPVYSQAIASPDPFVGLDALMASPTDAPQFHGGMHAAADHRFVSHQADKRKSMPTLHSEHSETKPSSHHHHVHHSLDSIPTPTSDFPFSPNLDHKQVRHEHEREDGNDPNASTFDFQVSVTSPASSPDIGLDAPVDFLLSPNSAPAGLDLSSPPNGTVPHEISSAPSHLSHGQQPFPYDLLSDPAASPPIAAHPPKHVRTVSNGRVRLGPSLGGVLEDAAESDDPSQRVNTGAHRLVQHHSHHEIGGNSNPDPAVSLGDLLSSPDPVNPKQNGAQAGNNAFFTQAKKTDHLSPHDSLSLPQSLAQKKQNMKTLPADFGMQLGDMFGGAGLGGQRTGDGISATGTKAQRSHTTADVDTFDPLFFPPSNERERTPHAHTQSLSIPMGQHNAMTAFAAHHQTKEDTEARKQQRTKSEADQAEAAILLGFKM